MEHMTAWILCGILALAALILGIRLVQFRRGLKKLCDDFEAGLSQDAGAPLAVSLPALRPLAAKLNRELAQLHEERRRFQNGDRELNDAVTNISHDLRTPLTAICGYLDLLDQEEKSDTVTRYLAQIQNRTQAMRELTEELFRYSMIRSQDQLHPEPVDLVRAVEDSLLSFYGVLEERGIRPQLDLPQVPVVRDLDRQALGRILSNLISNALKYSDGDLAVSVTPEGQITFSNSAKDLTPVEVGRLFDRFYTVETGRRSTGLGLSIAKLLTERMSGTLTAANRSPTLTLCLTFSAARGQSPQTIHAQAGQSSPTP